MVSPRRASSGSRGRALDQIWLAVAPAGTVLAAVAALACSALPAVTEPPPAPPPAPPDAAGALSQLDQVQREAEALTEQWHAAEEALTTSREDVAAAKAAVAPAELALAAAQQDEQSYRQQVDAVAMATFASGNPDQLDAQLAARSPQDFLDQMSALETICAEQRDALSTLVGKVDQTASAQADARAALARAQAAVDQAAAAERDLAADKRDADQRIEQAENLLDRMTPAERRARVGPTVAAPPIAGSGVGVEALRAAATQLGKPHDGGPRDRAATTAPGSPGGPSSRRASPCPDRAASRRGSAGPLDGRTCSPATSSSTTARSATSASTPATAPSSTRLRRATS